MLYILKIIRISHSKILFTICAIIFTHFFTVFLHSEEENYFDVHVFPGCGDYKMKDISFLPDPCPLPDHLKKRSLNAKERLTYAPLSGVGGVVYDKDAVYIDLGGSHHGKKGKVSVIY